MVTSAPSLELAVCPQGHVFHGEYVTTPSDDGRYTYEWGPACPLCNEEGQRPCIYCDGQVHDRRAQHFATHP